MLLSLDIDKFSLLSQVYGISKGNTILQLVAETVREKFSGENKAICAARLRDDVFVVLVKNTAPMEVYQSPEHAQVLIEKSKAVLNSNYAISISRGCYIIDDITLPAETIIDFCNQARREGKNTHGLSFTCFSEEMKNKLYAQKSIVYRMEQALEDEEFVLFFQPKIHLSNNEMCGAEVLVRWHPPGEPPIYPDDFINIFERNAFIAQLDMYVFEHACKFIEKHRNTHNIPKLAVNFSAITALHIDTHEHVKMLLQNYDIKPHELEIEITESALVEVSQTLAQNMQSLSALGFKLAIDDFGTGVSSLHRLSALQVDVVKLDKAFLDTKLNERKGIILIASLIRMLHHLKVEVVAEGVETERHVAILKKLQCDMAQGYYFSKPLSEENFLHVVPKVEPKSSSYIPKTTAHSSHAVERST